MQLSGKVKIICLSIVFFGLMNVWAFAADTDSLVVTETGNVGIGTASPEALLHIRATTSGANIYASVTDGPNAYGVFGYGLYVDNTRHEIARISGNYESSLVGGRGGLHFQTLNNGSLRPTMAIQGNGNVGIGTTNPKAKLDVNGSIKANNHLTHLPWYNLGTAPQGAWVPGHIKLITPIQQKESNMFSIKIKGYRYGLGGVPVEIQCGGYAYSAGGLIQTGCNTEGTADPVGIGVEDDHVVITIGSGTNIWYYDHFTAEYSGWNPKNPQDFKWEFVYNQPPTTSNTNNVIVNDAAGTIMASSYNSPSDVRWKEDIEPIHNALQRVSRLKGVNFQWAKQSRSGNPQVGVIAQEVEEIFPEVVSTDSEGYKSVAYSKLVPPLIEAVKELKAENEELRSKLEALSARLDGIAKN